MIQNSLKKINIFNEKIIIKKKKKKHLSIALGHSQDS